MRAQETWAGGRFRMREREQAIADVCTAMESEPARERFEAPPAREVRAPLIDFLRPMSLSSLYRFTESHGWLL